MQRTVWLQKNAWGSQGCMRGAALVGDGSQEECGRVPRGSGSPEVLCRSGMACRGRQPGCMGIPKRCCVGQEGVPEGQGLGCQEVPCGSGMTHGGQCMSGKVHWGTQEGPCGSRKAHGGSMDQGECMGLHNRYCMGWGKHVWGWESVRVCKHRSGEHAGGRCGAQGFPSLPFLSLPKRQISGCCWVGRE